MIKLLYIIILLYKIQKCCYFLTNLSKYSTISKYVCVCDKSRSSVITTKKWTDDGHEIDSKVAGNVLSYDGTVEEALILSTPLALAKPAHTTTTTIK